MFASRNRLLAALSDVVVVVQGREGSGALHTVEAARQLGRPVGAVPWEPREPLGEISLRLIREGAATLIRDARDVAELVPVARRHAPLLHVLADSSRYGSATVATDAEEAPPTGTEALLLASLRYRAEPLEAVASRSGLSIAEAGAALLALELRKIAERGPGGLVRRRRPRRSRSVAS
jgi:DNA processing protein